MLSARIYSLRYAGRHLAASQQLVLINSDMVRQYHVLQDTKKRNFMTTPPRQGLIGAVFLIGGLSWSYNYLKRESYIRRGMMPPPSSNMLGQTFKTFLFAATLPITLPIMMYKFIKGDMSFFNKIDPFNFGNFGNFGNSGNYQDPRSQQSYYQEYHYQQPNNSYGKRMEWIHIPGMGWQYVEVEVDDGHNQKQYSSFYEDFEDFFENSRRQQYQNYHQQQQQQYQQYHQQQQQQQQQQGWNYEDIFGTRTGMSRQEALRVLGLKPTATKQEIQIAHKKMLMKHHPDHGGSTEMASKINQARDVLLGKK